MTDILRDLGKIARALDSIANIEFKEFSLTRGQYLYLVRIYENPGIIQEKLAELIKVDRTTAARAIAKLEKNGLIEKQPQADNKKNKSLFVTNKGAKIAPIIQAENQYSNKVALKDFSEPEMQQLAAYLARVEKNVAKDWDLVKKGERRLYGSED
ncbi:MULTISPECIES: MarR family winged helix-turn-helix transcriptional regulator [Enterococcus]|uniref:MarR family transcriptional regulator n=1 Tax=Enterococcus dispar ATCC 51266 TaxID=1139219 RepID=S0KEH1_9ENTE|nr:MarR family transcriptional regulator [Enterococcus dispar]EOT39300.1 MarR family transcriptional regulator [Enterococcus dispar ATCC 51266]EOW86285.1 MarR family transcriptional regulator [Enterococcus dispar ATCC 51266]MCU7357221.1 MarR family transcriptional regulator [Enterococcus dispar]MDT2705301.1 MarR family transcriptional regulator [Enterococcus dispar]OJG39284.1 MarR family transcriptional regulator [Enterococcus dispar]